MVLQAKKAAELLAKDGIRPTVVDARFVKPLDQKAYADLFARHRAVLTIEDNVIHGGYGQSIALPAHRTGTLRRHPQAHQPAGRIRHARGNPGAAQNPGNGRRRHPEEGRRTHGPAQSQSEVPVTAVSMDPKKPGDSEERRNSHSNAGDDNEGDFDLSGFASDDASARAQGGPGPGKKPARRPTKSRPAAKRWSARRRASSRAIPFPAAIGPRATPAGPPRDPPDQVRPDRSGHGPGGKPGYPPRKGPAGPRGGWEKLPQRENFRGKDQGFVPRGPRNATGPAGAKAA